MLKSSKHYEAHVTEERLLLDVAVHSEQKVREKVAKVEKESAWTKMGEDEDGLEADATP